ncbi:permease [Streptococcus pneumoniae]|nr:permease [Streptococcus pneumoniae]VRV13388.1 permease [Streptococcus pneumoniae]VRW83429.1 permease [Streptococcus pneumoniae]VRY28684.1 permease [Streptococcus pneumoniae]VRY57150.1 permease [Streptococcus pneumoniae]
MLRLVYYQFLHNKKQWLGVSPVIFVSSLVMGLAVNGVINVENNSQVFVGLPDPKPIFMFPIVFGGVTLFFVLSNIINMLVEIFRDDYELLEVLGASRLQLSFLVGGQIFIISSIISFIAYLCSIFVTSNYYYFLQYFFGENILPDIQFQTSAVGCIITVVLISFLAFLSGCFYTFKKIRNRKSSKIRHVLSIVKRILLLAGFSVIWLLSLQQIFQDSTILAKAQIIFNIVILDIVIIYQLSPFIQLCFIKLLSIIIFRNNFMFIVSKWNLLYCKSYIKSISAAITGAILLISSFQMISQNILSQFQDDSDLELKVAFIVYVGAPILIVLANIISIAFLSSHQERIEIQQFEILGTSNYQMVKIKVGEAIFLTFVTSLIAFLLNIKIMALIYYSLEDILIDDMNLLGLILPNFIVSIILFILIFITKSSYFIFKNAKIIS